MPILTTPSERFENIPEWPYQTRYLGKDGLKMAYVDETGPILDKTGQEVTSLSPASSVHEETWICLHGEPTWGYLYRRIIPVLLRHRNAKSGPDYVRRRVLIPDLIGMGKSSKPTEDDFYTFDMHFDHLSNFIRSLKLVSFNLIVQDWGGLLGLCIPPEFPSQITGLFIMNTGLGLGKGVPSKGFAEWREYCRRTPDMPVGQVISRGTKHLTKAEIRAYDAPFPDITYKASVRSFPNMVMTEPNMQGVNRSRNALKWYQDNPSLLSYRVFICVGIQDPVLGLGPMEALSRSAFKNTEHYFIRVENAGHFVQEFEGVEGNGSFTTKMLDSFDGSPVPDVELRKPRASL